jgi:hypothetical protein
MTNTGQRCTAYAPQARLSEHADEREHNQDEARKSIGREALPD